MPFYDFLITACENAGMSPEGVAQLDKIGAEAFAGVSTIDLASLNATDYGSLETAMDDAGAPAEAKEQLKKIKSLLINSES